MVLAEGLSHVASLRKGHRCGHVRPTPWCRTGEASLAHSSVNTGHFLHHGWHGASWAHPPFGNRWPLCVPPQLPAMTGAHPSPAGPHSSPCSLPPRHTATLRSKGKGTRTPAPPSAPATGLHSPGSQPHVAKAERRGPCCKAPWEPPAIPVPAESSSVRQGVGQAEAQGARAPGLSPSHGV